MCAGDKFTAIALVTRPVDLDYIGPAPEQADAVCRDRLASREVDVTGGGVVNRSSSGVAQGKASLHDRDLGQTIQAFLWAGQAGAGRGGGDRVAGVELCKLLVVPRVLRGGGEQILVLTRPTIRYESATFERTIENEGCSRSRVFLQTSRGCT